MTFRMALALTPLAVLVACKPDPAVVHRDKGDDLLRQSDFRGAAAEYEQALARDPKQQKVLEKLAFCRVKTGEKDLAAAALVKAANLEAGDARKAEAFRNAAGVFLQGPDRAKAEKFLAEAVRLDPSDEASLTWLGELASERGGARFELQPAVPEELDKAIRYYDRLIELRPEGKAAHANRRIAVVKYLGHLAEERHREEARLSRSRRDASAAAKAREHIARIDARSAELRRMLDESNAKLAPARKRSAT